MPAPGTRRRLTIRPGRLLDLLGRVRAEAEAAREARDLADRRKDQDPLGRGMVGRDKDLAGRDKDLAGRGKDLAGRGRDLAERDPAHRGKDLADQGKDLAARHLADQDKDLPGRGKDRDPGQAKDQDRVDQAPGRGRADPDTNRDPLDRVLQVQDKGPDPADRRPADPHQAQVRTRLDPSRTRRRALTIGALTKWAARLMRLAASAHSATARRLLRRQEDSVGMTDLLLAGRRLTGMGRPLQAAGTVLRLRVVGTAAGPDRHATLAAHGATSGRSTMAASPPFRSSIRFSVGGASGSSVFGSRCTDGK